MASLCARSSCSAVAPARVAQRGRRTVAVLAKKTEEVDRSLDSRGVITSDNSGKMNIFPTSSKAYYSSVRGTAIATSGLGGIQGAGVVAAALGVVALALAGVVTQQDTETLAQVNNRYQGESLSVIADRISGSL
ncbi:hypothetical protein HYH03_002741 [Edaphochlamys debaryana]|uniref:Uncharacterized protein n=1 Tax=Edaphochlamys debaryana TaxID=47281 RepID=A0A835YIC0_9CHLO|nr:hypothetical protein HYH03_002741 [Edaphochlamys debaryana]|eukprot:KAG2499160.1 hypothetical protein HYH03_002741 [Edaphochlamys debaryana]